MTLRPEARTAAQLKRIKLVLMDVDGTLVTSDSTTFGRVVEQLRRLKSVGVNFSIATGRTIGGVAPVLHQMRKVGAKLPPMITYNGAVVAAGERPLLLKTRTIDRSAFTALVEHCRILRVSAHAYACTATPFGQVRETTFTEEVGAPAAEFNGSIIRPVDDLLKIDEDIVAVLIKRPVGQEGDVLQADLAGRFGSIMRVTTSGGPYIEICHSLGTKLNAMAELVQMLRIDAADVMAIGDNYNDLEMIEGAGVGVAVANAPKSVKAAASLVCTRSGADGVVEVLRVLTRVIRTEKALTGALARAT